MLERFTVPARQVVIKARSEAVDLGHRSIGTEHILLGLLDPDASPAADLLRDARVRPEHVRDEIVRITGAGTSEDTGTDGPAGLGGLDEQDAAALRMIGIDIDAVRAKIEESFGPGALDLAAQDPPRTRRLGFLPRARPDRPGHPGRPGRSNRIPFNPRAKKVLELSVREAVRLRSDHIGTEHLLLGLIRDGDGLGAKILAAAEVDFAELRRRAEAANRRAA